MLRNGSLDHGLGNANLTSIQKLDAGRNSHDEQLKPGLNSHPSPSFTGYFILPEASPDSKLRTQRETLPFSNTLLES